jgi:hypothetical protein
MIVPQYNLVGLLPTVLPYFYLGDVASLCDDCVGKGFRVWKLGRRGATTWKFQRERGQKYHGIYMCHFIMSRSLNEESSLKEGQD